MGVVQPLTEAGCRVRDVQTSLMQAPGDRDQARTCVHVRNHRRRAEGSNVVVCGIMRHECKVQDWLCAEDTSSQSTTSLMGSFPHPTT